MTRRTHAAVLVTLLLAITTLASMPRLRTLTQAPNTTGDVRASQQSESGRPSTQLRAMWVFADTARATIRDIERAILRAGGEVRVTSHWLHAISADLTPNQVTRLRATPAVLRVQPVGHLIATATAPAPAPSAPFSAFSSAPSSAPSSANSRFSAPSSALSAQQDSAYYGPNFRALRDLGIPNAHILNFTGRGIRIAILDTGFDLAHEVFARTLQLQQVRATRDFINNDTNVTTEPGDPPTPRDQEVHGTWVWSLLGGNLPGRIVGPAVDADFLLAKVDVEQVEMKNLAADEDRWVQAVEWAGANGARIINSSLAYQGFLDKRDYAIADLNGDIAVSTVMADEAARRNILVITSIGNGGPTPQSLMAPADADSVISVGAIDPLGQILANSGRGPTADGRNKPELVARGNNLFVASARTGNRYDTRADGPSLSTPLVSGVAAVFMQAWPSLTAAAVRNALMLSASQSHMPDSNRGWGMPNVAAAILFPEGLTPTSISTTDTNNNLTTLAPVFHWSAPLTHPSMRPVRFILQVARDSQFNSMVLTDTATDANSIALRRPIKPAQNLYWRVIAETFPAIQRITRPAGPFHMPKWVRLLTFDDPGGSVASTSQPQFRWQTVAAPAPVGPLTYDVEVFNAQDLTVVQRVRSINTSTFVPTVPLTPNLAYRWRVIANTRVGIADTVESRGSFVVNSSDKPPTTLLYAGFPNPFPNFGTGELFTRFWFDIADRADVDFAIYDLRGRLIRQLIPATPDCGRVTLDPGQYGRGAGTDPCVGTRWDGTNHAGEHVARGVYIARLRAGSITSTQRVLYLP